MEMAQHLGRLFAYDAWANRVTLASLQGLGAPPERSLHFLGHILAAQYLWLDRLNGSPPRMAVWPDAPLERCEAQVSELADLWPQYLGALTPARLLEAIAYQNTKGESWSNTVQDVLLHALMHSAYHRAQIASDLRDNGHTPPYTDYIECVRRGFVK